MMVSAAKYREKKNELNKSFSQRAPASKQSLKLKRKKKTMCTLLVRIGRHFATSKRIYTYAHTRINHMHNLCTLLKYKHARLHTKTKTNKQG